MRGGGLAAYSYSKRRHPPSTLSVGFEPISGYLMSIGEASQPKEPNKPSILEQVDALERKRANTRVMKEAEEELGKFLCRLMCTEEGREHLQKVAQNLS